MKIIDISIPVSPETPLYLGDPDLKINKDRQIKQGDPYNFTSLSMGVHTATHLDAPLHFIENGKSITDLPLARFMGKAQVVDITNKEEITVQELKEKDLKSDFLLFKTNNSKLYGPEFKKDYIALSEEAAGYLLEKKVKLIGIDYLSVDKFAAFAAPVHKLLLKEGVILLEGINLAGVEEGIYTLVAFPLKIQGSEAAPCRAVLLHSE